jgi:hypothetical protein
VDQLLDEAYSNQFPEPECAGLDDGSDGSDSDDDACYTIQRGEGQHETEESGVSGAAEGHKSLFDRLQNRPLRSRPRGVTSVFTWAGNGCCLGPLGSLLPELRHLNVALPPSLAGLVLQEDAGGVDGLPEAAISFTNAPCMGPVATEVEGTDRHQQLELRDVQSADGSEGEARGDAAVHSVAGISSAATLPRAQHFVSLRHLSIGNLTAETSQWDPSARLGDALMAAIGEGLPSLETLQVGERGEVLLYVHVVDYRCSMPFELMQPRSQSSGIALLLSTPPPTPPMNARHLPESPPHLHPPPSSSSWTVCCASQAAACPGWGPSRDSRPWRCTTG